MSKETKYSRILLKRTNVPGLSATTAPHDDHTQLPAWKTSDVYVGEFFLNIEDEKLWIRTTNSIKEIPLFDGSSSLNSFPDVTITNPTDGQVLTFSGGTWINKNPQFEGTGITYSMVSPLMMTSPSTLSSPIPTETIVQEIDKLIDIKDVSVSKLQNFDVLIQKDGNWINMSAVNLPVKKPTLEQIANVDIKDVESEQFLVYSGDRWINKTKLNKIQSLAWDKAESKLIIETDEGTYNLSIQGKPIHTIVDDIELNNSLSTIIVDTSAQDISIYLPTASLSYGDVYTIKVINYTHDTIIIPADSEFIFTDSLLSEFIISEDSDEKTITLHCDGNSTWYSI